MPERIALMPDSFLLVFEALYLNSEYVQQLPAVLPQHSAYLEMPFSYKISTPDVFQSPFDAFPHLQDMIKSF
jgi:hypothetical protein